MRRIRSLSLFLLLSLTLLAFLFVSCGQEDEKSVAESEAEESTPAADKIAYICSPKDGKGIDDSDINESVYEGIREFVSDNELTEGEDCFFILPSDESYEAVYSLIIVGDSGVGKSCLSIKATRNYFEDFYSPTVGFEFLTFNLKIEDKTVKLQIWDTCGQEVYRSLISSFYRSASLAILVYSIENEESFASLEKWLNDIKTQSSPDIKIFLIANKSDLEEKRKVTRAAGEKFSNEHNITFFTEASAKTGFNVQNIFMQAAKELYLQHEEIKNRVSRPGSMTLLPDNQENESGYKIESEEEENRNKSKCPC